MTNLIKNHKSLSLEDLRDKGIIQQLKNTYNQSKSNSGFFLDAYCTATLIPKYAHNIIHRLPDKEHPNGLIIHQIDFEYYNDFCELGWTSYDELGKKIAEITHRIRIDRFGNGLSHNFIGTEPFTIDNVIDWINEYAKLDLVEKIIVDPRW